MVTVVEAHLWEDEVAAVDWQPIELGWPADAFLEVVSVGLIQLQLQLDHASVDLIQLDHATDVTYACWSDTVLLSSVMISKTFRFGVKLMIIHHWLGKGPK